MATAKRVYGTIAQIIGTGDGYITLSGTTESYSSDVDLETNGYEGAHVTVEIDFDTTPTDDVNVKVYGSLDGTTYDNIPLYALQVSRTLDPSRITIIVRDVLHFRVGVVQTGSTDSHNVRSYQQTWRWDVS